MSVISPNTTSARLALSMLTAQAGPGRATASVTAGIIKTGEAASNKGSNTGSNTAPNMGQRDINAIADAKRERALARAAAASKAFQDQNKPSIERRKAKATAREIIRLKQQAQNMSNALQRLGSAPLGDGQRILSLFSKNGGGAVLIQSTGQVDSVYVQGADQALAIKARTATSIHTGAGHDAVTIEADFVASVHTDRSAGYVPAYRENGEQYARRVERSSSNDAVAIKARWAQSVYTGGGNDAVAVQADMVESIYAGQGHDGISVMGGVVSGIHAEEGNDTISVNAAIGYSVMRNLQGSAADYTADPSPDYMRPTNAEDRMRLAATNYSDVLGGDGDDAISVTVQEVISIDGGSGNDVISIGGGTVGIRVGAGSGDDIVKVAQGAELMVQIDRGDYAVEIDGDAMVIRHSGGSVRVEEYENAAAIGVTRFGAARYRSDPIAGSPEALRMEEDRKQLDDLAKAAQQGGVTDLEVGASPHDLGIEIARSGGFDMLHISVKQPLERRV